MKTLELILVLIWAFVPGITQADAPRWTKNTERQIDNGDIIQWGTGEADSEGVALFKARESAIQKLIEECGGIANKEIIPRKDYVESVYGKYRGFAQVSLEFMACQAAKGPDGKRLQNEAIAENQKQYAELMGLQKGTREQRKLEGEIHDRMIQAEQYQMDEVSALRTEIDLLRAKMNDKKVAEEASRAPAETSSRQQCMQQYQSMLNQLRQDSLEFHGNMSAPPLQSEYSQVETKHGLCQRMK